MSRSRTLLVTERRITALERAEYMSGLVRKRAKCARAGVQFWVFEHDQESHRFLEFVEAKDSLLLDALELDVPPATRWRAVELA